MWVSRCVCVGVRAGGWGRGGVTQLAYFRPVSASGESGQPTTIDFTLKSMLLHSLLSASPGNSWQWHGPDSKNSRRNSQEMNEDTLMDTTVVVKWRSRAELSLGRAVSFTRPSPGIKPKGLGQSSDEVLSLNHIAFICHTNNVHTNGPTLFAYLFKYIL